MHLANHPDAKVSHLCQKCIAVLCLQHPFLVCIPVFAHEIVHTSLHKGKVL